MSDVVGQAEALRRATIDASLQSFLVSLQDTLAPGLRFESAIGVPDPWQEEFLSAEDEFILALCSRQVGKSTATSCIAWDAVSRGKFVIIVAPSERQSKELLRKVLTFKHADRAAPAAIRSTMTELELANGGRLICAPSDSDTIRGFSAVDLLIFEEAAFMLDDVITAVMPMRADNGKIVMISTPAGRAGLFYELWTGGKVRKVSARSINIPRLSAKVEFDRQHMPAIKFRQEHLCEFLGSGTPFFDPDAIARAINHDVGALRL